MTEQELDLHSHTFPAMGVVVELIVECVDADAASAALQAAELRVHELAASFTRFDGGSELMRLNSARSAVVSSDLFDVIELALAARASTGARFDPTVHDAMVAAGYDRTFTELTPATAGHGDNAVAAGQDVDGAEVWRALPEVELDATTQTVTLMPGASLDLGGIAKGYIADVVCDLLGETGAALVNAGGDIACSQRAGDEMWSIEVDLVVPPADARADGDAPHPNSEPLVLTLDAGGIATSGVTRRRWLDAATGETQHHVIDPLTGTSVRTDVASVTVVADRCTTAEVWATALLIAGARAAIAEARAADLAAVVCCADGSVVFTGPLG